MRVATWLSASTVLLISVAAQAQNPPGPPAGPPGGPMANMQRFNGTIESVDGKTLKVKSNEAGSIALRLTPDTRIMTREKATPADIGANTFVGCTAVKQASGELQATECHIFPESMRGVGEGHYPWGNAADTTMTNGAVATMTNGSVQAAGGNAGGPLLKIGYKGGGEQNIQVTPKTELTKIVTGDAATLKPGMRVGGAARPGADGGADVMMLNVMP